MANVKEAIKETIRDVLFKEFRELRDVLSKELNSCMRDKLREAVWAFLKSKLDLVGWPPYARSKAVMEAERTPWKKIEELVDEYRLEADFVWRVFVVEPAAKLCDRHEYENIFREKGLDGVAENISIGYDETVGGLFVAIRPTIQLTNKLLDVDVDKVIDRFLKQINEEKLNELEREFLKAVENLKEEGREVSEQKVLEKVVENFLKEQEKTLGWLCAEESENVKKFIEAVKEVEKELVAYLLSVDVYVEKQVREMVGANEGRKLSREQAFELLKGELRKVLTNLDKDRAAYLVYKLVVDDLESCGFKIGYPFIVMLKKVSDSARRHAKDLGKEAFNRLIERLSKKLEVGLREVLKECGFNESAAESMSVAYEHFYGFAIRIAAGELIDLEFSGDREKVLKEFLEKEQENIRRWLEKRDYRTEVEVSWLVEKMEWDLMSDYVKNCDDIHEFRKSFKEAMLRMKSVEEAIAEEVELEVSKLLEAGSEPRL